MNRPLSQIDVINMGALRSHPVRPTLACPFCGDDPHLAMQIGTRFVVGCNSDDCDAQQEGLTLSEAWAKWNLRTT